MRKMIFAQTCDSRECRNKFKEQLSKLCEAITTVHEVDFETREVKCTICGKVSKLGKTEK